MRRSHQQKHYKESIDLSQLPIEVQGKLARLEAFTELNPRPVIEIDFVGNVIEANTVANTIFPDLRKLGAKHPYLADLAGIVARLKKDHRPFTREVKIGDCWYRQVFYYISHFNLIHVYGSDVTDRKETERNLAKSELRYHSLFNKMSEGYALYELIVNKAGKPVDYRFLDINPAFEKLTGLRRSETVGKTMRQLLPTNNLQWIAEYGQVALSGKPAHLERYHKDVDRYYEIFVYKTEEMQFATLILDITSRRRAEEEKNNFISIMSHELRNPLTPILAGAQILRNTIAKNPNIAAVQSISTYSQIIERQSRNMARLLDDLLDVSRMSRDKLSLDIQPMSVATVTKHAVEAVMPLVQTQKQTLVVQLPKKDVCIEADPVRFEQIMVNLINNAVKYTRPKGRIAVIVRLISKHQVQIRVKDNGVGIGPRKINTIFDLFKKTNEHQPFIYIGGLGIGLNITRHLVNMQRGTITVRSKGKNKGSEFIITFPVCSGTVANSVKKLVPKAHGATKRRILIVEDNKDIAHLLSELLISQGHQTKVVHTGSGIISVYRSFKPDAALVDIGLPTISGYEVAKQIRSAEKNARKKTLLIALTGYGQHKDKILSQQAGFTYHLTKPVDASLLLAILSQA